MTSTFRKILEAHFLNCGIDDPVAYLADRGSLEPKTVENYFRSGSYPIGDKNGLSTQQAWWLIGESRAAIQDDAAGLPNMVEKILRGKLDEYHGRRARKRQNDRPRRKAKRPGTRKTGG